MKTVCQERFLPERRTPPQVLATFVLKTHHKDVYNHQIWPMYNHASYIIHRAPAGSVSPRAVEITFIHHASCLIQHDAGSVSPRAVEIAWEIA